MARSNGSSEVPFINTSEATKRSSIKPNRERQMYKCHELLKSCGLVNLNLHKPPLQLITRRQIIIFSLSRIFTDLIMHSYRSNRSVLMTRCRTDFRHQYGMLFGGESQTSFTRNVIRAGSEGRLFLQAICLASDNFW